MVVDLLDDAAADEVLHALADATRRDIVRRAVGGRHSVSALARHYPMSTTAVAKHVDVLVAAGLVRKQRHGREQRVVADLDRLSAAARYLARMDELWRERVERMDRILAEQPQSQAPAPPDTGRKP